MANVADSKPALRRLGDAAVVFDPLTWQTHLLPPAAAVVVEVITELSPDRPMSIEAAGRAVQEDLELDPQAPEIRTLLQMLCEIGMLRR